jgi:CarD family transcriptional regulator
MFLLGEKIVYPGHGVAKVNRIVEKIIAGSISKFYELTFLNKEMQILVPINNAESIGIRRLCSSDRVNDIFTILSCPVKDTKNRLIVSNNWNKRNKEYQSKLRTGDLRDISQIYRDLKHLEQYKELSFGEKNLLQQTEGLLAQEIAIVTDIGSEEQAVQRIRSTICYTMNPEHQKNL